jgi:hypothetical protein
MASSATLTRHSSSVLCRGHASRALGFEVKLSSEAEAGELRLELSDALVVDSLGASGLLLCLDSVESGGLDLSLVFQFVDEVQLGPASLGSEITDGAELSVGLQSENLEGLWDDHSLLVVEWEWDSLVDSKTAESGLTAWLLVGEHATDGLPEHTGWGFPMLETASWVGVDALVHRFLSVHLVSVERARLENLFAADDDDSLAGDQFLGDDACETAHQVTTSINDNFLFEHA